MTITIQDGDVVLKGVSTEQYNTIKSWNMMRWVKQEQALRGRAGMPLLDKLATLGKLPPGIEAKRQELHKTADTVNAERNKENPKPLIKYPVKQSLYQHQIRGANMALLTFGFNPEKGDFDE